MDSKSQTLTVKTVNKPLLRIIALALAEKVRIAGESSKIEVDSAMRQIQALKKATNLVINNEARFSAYSYDGVIDSFAVQSETKGLSDGVIYTPTESVCQCPAFKNGEKICWHRGLYIILKHYAPIDTKQKEIEELYSSVGITVRHHTYLVGGETSDSELRSLEADIFKQLFEIIPAAVKNPWQSFASRYSG